ncbi:hypothetical protein [Halosimplex sp. TS25]|uniref:hypothetical protein n=1 Tax=Halosimplex rarum TaxID=3396619 RepID=UPI0039EAB9D4
MLDQDIKSAIRTYLVDQGDTGYLYFDFYFSSKRLSEDLTVEFLKSSLGTVDISKHNSIQGDGHLIRIGDAPILFWELDNQKWFVVYSSTGLSQANRNKLSKAHKKVGWILPAQLESDVVDNLYQEFSREEESVNIERRWDPYWVYERGSEIPESLRDYYKENIEEFVEKEIEFNVKTPGWLVDTAFKQGVKEDLLNKSEISQSRFTYDPDKSSSTVSDGGVSADEDFQSSVTIRQRGEVVHRSGVPEATFTLLDEVEIRDSLFDELAEIVPERETHRRENGIVDTTHFNPGGELHITFKEKDFDQEASITLSNLLTVGQDDVKIHGVIQWRDELEFLAETYTPFDEGEYRILFTSVEDDDGDERASLHIRPRSATAAGLVYVFQKLKEKFDPRVEYEIEHPKSMEV